MYVYQIGHLSIQFLSLKLHIYITKYANFIKKLTILKLLIKFHNPIFNYSFKYIKFKNLMN